MVRFMFMGGTSSIVVGFSFATDSGCTFFQKNLRTALIEQTGTAPSTLLLISLGLVVLVCGGFYEVYTKREALFPPTTFKDLSAGKIQIRFSS